jgi:hypothetical protein
MVLTFSDESDFCPFFGRYTARFGPISSTTSLLLGPEDQPKLVSRHCFAESMFPLKMQCLSVCVLI